jgi:hypothetical protein
MKRRIPIRRRLLVTILFLGVAGQVRLLAQEVTLSTAKDLYAAAAYEEALNVLDGLKGGGQTDDSNGVNQYRALCLLALGRKTDAERAIEEVVTSEPMYQPAEAEVSPRIRTAFSEVRRRMLPTIAQQQYAQAKAAFDHKEFQSAAEQFKAVLDVMSDPALNADKEPGLADLKTLAAGFLELATAAAAPPPAPEPAPAPVAEVALSRAPVVYGVENADVVPPSPVKQEFPRWSRTVVPKVPPGRGVLEVIVAENGDVESATLRQPMTPVYDSLVLTAAKNWKYRPATKDGQPVRYKKLIQVTLVSQ